MTLGPQEQWWFAVPAAVRELGCVRTAAGEGWWRKRRDREYGCERTVDLWGLGRSNTLHHTDRPLVQHVEMCLCGLQEAGQEIWVGMHFRLFRVD